jgi:hypothetical protein
MANIFCHNPTTITFLFKTHLGFEMMWTEMRIIGWAYTLIWTHWVFRFLDFVIVNFLRNDNEIFFVVISFFILAITITILRGHVKECRMVCCLCVLNAWLISTNLLVEEIGITFMEFLKLDSAIESIRWM